MMVKNINFLKFYLIFVVLFTLFSHDAPAQTKKVFAHYMVCFPSYDGGTVEGFKKDIQDAQREGIDGYALNCGDWNETYKRNTANLFQAALELNTGFKFFFSADMNSGLGPEQIRDMITTYFKHPNYFRYNNRPFLSAWTGASVVLKLFWLDQFINPFKKQGTNIYMIPFTYTLAYEETPGYDSVLKNYNEWWKGFCDGFFYFGAAGLPDYDADASILKSGEAFAKVFHDSTRTYMASVTPEYWGDVQKGERRYFEYAGGEGLANQWRSIINIQKPEWVELVTWNDWSEMSYFSPMDDISKYFRYTSHPELGFHKSHKGYADLNRYYIRWYKTGKQPAIENDQLYFFYRTQPKDLVVNDPAGPVTGRHGVIKDEIFITTILKAPATLKVTSGKADTSIAVAKGIVNTRVPFKVGNQYFELLRGNKTIVKAKGEPIVDTVKKYNFTVYSGSATN